MLQKNWISSPEGVCSKAESCPLGGWRSMAGLSTRSVTPGPMRHNPSWISLFYLSYARKPPKPAAYQILLPGPSTPLALTEPEITCTLRKCETNLTGLTTPALSSDTARSSFQLSLTGSKMTNICNICQVMNALRRVMQLSTFWWL